MLKEPHWEQAMMKAFLNGGVNEVLATVHIDNHGSQQLTLSAPETTRETEICVLLGVTVLMYWWESDRSS